MVDVYTQKCTIYNVTPSKNGKPQKYNRMVIDRCSIQSGYVDKSKGVARQVVNATTIITKNIMQYRPPTWQTDRGYYSLDNKDGFFTAAPGDVIVFCQVEDVVTNATEMAKLKSDYRECSMTISQAWASLSLPTLANIKITNA